jgi:putative transposase
MEYPKSNIFSFQQHPIRQSTRLPGYDYTQPGAYFVTICTHERKSLLGNISDGVMILNSNGEIVQSCWTEITVHFTSTELSVYIIMPNHFHGIVIINDSVAARHAVPSTSESFGKPVGRSLPTIIRSFKSAVTKRVNLNSGIRQFPFWQKSYYEHVIRSEAEFAQIGEYILGNPLKWEMDRENPFSQKTVKPLPFEY